MDRSVIQIQGINIDTYYQYCESTLNLLESINYQSLNIDNVDTEIVTIELDSMNKDIENHKEQITVMKQLDENIINSAVNIYNDISKDLDQLKSELDTTLENVDNIDNIETIESVKRVSSSWSMNVLSKLIFGMMLMMAVYQIFGLGDVVQGSLTATGTIISTSSNKIIKGTGMMIASAGVAGSLIDTGTAINVVNSIANEKIGQLTSVAQQYSNAIGDSVINAYIQSIKLLGDIKGNIFEWIGGGKPEIAGLIGPGYDVSTDQGFRLTTESVKILDQSSNIYNTLLKHLSLKAASPDDMAVAVWDPSKKVLMDALAKTLTVNPELGLGTWFNSALDYVWKVAPTNKEIAAELVLTYGTAFLAELVEGLSGGIIPVSAIQQVQQTTGGKIGAAELKMLLDNAKVFMNYAK